MYGEEVSDSARKEKVPGTEGDGMQCSTFDRVKCGFLEQADVCH